MNTQVEGWAGTPPRVVDANYAMAFQRRKERPQLLPHTTRGAKEMRNLHETPFTRADGTPETPGNPLQNAQRWTRTVEEGHV